MRWLSAGALTGIVSVVLCGCSVSEGSSPAAGDPEKCLGGMAEPVSSERVGAALRAHGFSAHRNADQCGGAADGVMEFANSGIAADQEGLVFCSVRRRPIYGTGFRRLVKTNKQTAKFAVDNVECVLYASGHPKEQARRLVAAMHAMMKAP
jgi:hypothetical protein